MRSRPGATGLAPWSIAAGLFVLLGLGAGPGSADVHPYSSGDGPGEFRMFKSPNEDLRIRWSAAVHEEGGEFLISRRAQNGTPQVIARVALRAEGKYEVVEQSVSGSWVYQLRYRNRRGREHVLATIQLKVGGLEPARDVVPATAQVQEAALWVAPALPPPAQARVWIEPSEAPLGGPDRWPPTPPP